MFSFIDPPPFDPARVLFEDDDVIVVDKPEGVPSQSADPSRPDDLVYRLSLFLSRRDGVAPERAYLGVHQRLDQDTSGAILFSKRKDANASLARQFEGRAVDKRYLALVRGWHGGNRTLEHRLARGADGKTHVVRDDPRAQRAVSVVRVLEREGAYALLEVRIETGRTHQIRAQLAREGAPVVGDRLYGGAPAVRLMLHARSIELAHPTRDGRLRVEAPEPTCLRAALRDGAATAAAAPPSQERKRESAGPRSSRRRDALADVLARAVERRWGLAHRAATEVRTTAYRLLDGDSEGAPGLVVDAYDAWLVAQLYTPEAEARLDETLDALEALGARGVYLKRRPRQANVIVDARSEELAPSLPVRGEAAPEPLVVYEHGLPLRVRLGEGLSTGVFLDQRENRARVRELAAGARVLNLFSYTCAFTLAAAAGGAVETLSVDASRRLLAWGRENLAFAGFTSEGHRFEAGDVFEVLTRLSRDGARFDLVCLDPPTYSTTRASRWKSGKDWTRLAALTFEVLAPGGRLLACSNDRRMSGHALRRHLHEAARDAGVTLAQLKDLPCPPDHPPPFAGEPHLKSVLARCVAREPRASRPTARPSRRSAPPRR
jgi:23S rRNA (cytosine1962-C5)-methyltransferase